MQGTTILAWLPPGLTAIDWRLPWLIFASFLGGALNAVAGGGSFLTFPAMLGVGLGPIQANATNTVALWPGQLTSIAGYRDEVRKHKPLAVKMALAGLVGGSIGAIILLNTPAKTFIYLVPWLLLFAALIFAVSDPVMKHLQRRAQARSGVAVESAEAQAERNYWPLVLATIVICFYIGYFGAGAGFLLMTALSLFGVEEMRALNSLKVLGACISNLSAVVTFIFGGAIEWHYCLISMLFAAAGGWVGAIYARRMNPDVLRAVVVITGCIVAAYFFWRSA